VFCFGVRTPAAARYVTHTTSPNENGDRYVATVAKVVESPRDESDKMFCC